MTRLRMTPLDASWFLIESERVPVHGAFLCIFSSPADAKPGYARRVLAAMKRRPVGAPFNLEADLSNPLKPRWREVAVDPTDHLIETRLPAGSTRADLMSAAAEAARQRLDRSRPLWRAHWFEGLADGQFALLLVLHHAQWDGISFMRLLRENMKVASGNRVRAPWEGVSTWKRLVSSERGRQPGARRDARLQGMTRVLGDLGSVARDLAGTVAKQGLGMVRGERSVPLPLAATETRFGRSITSPRTYGLAAIDADRVKAVAKATDASFNDVLTTVIDAAYEGYLKEAGHTPSKPLVALVPIAIKTTNAGNQISGAFVALGEPDATPKRRLSTVRRNMADAKADIGAMSMVGAKVWAMLNMGIAATPDLLALGDRLPATANMMISNPYGIPERLFLGRSRLEEFAPLIGPSLGTRAMFGIYTYADTAFISVTSLVSVIPDVERMTALIGEAFDALEASTRPAQRKARRTSKP